MVAENGEPQQTPEDLGIPPEPTEEERARRAQEVLDFVQAARASRPALKQYDADAAERESRAAEAAAIRSQAGAAGGADAESSVDGLPPSTPDYVPASWMGYVVYQCRFCPHTKFSRVKAEEHPLDPAYRTIHQSSAAWRARYTSAGG